MRRTRKGATGGTPDSDSGSTAPRGSRASKSGESGGQREPDVGVGPVVMPDLPPTLTLSLEQSRVMMDPLRVQILTVIQHQPVTIKEIARQLHIPPANVSYQLRVLEAAGLAQVVARRLVNGIAAKYYTRTARIFLLELADETADSAAAFTERLRRARAELAETLSASPHTPEGDNATYLEFFHVRLSAERAQYYRAQIDTLIEAIARESSDPNGEVYGVCSAIFLAPPSFQVVETHPSQALARTEEGA